MKYKAPDLFCGVVSLDRCLLEQRLCADVLRDPQCSARDKAGATMGLADWVMEEVLVLHDANTTTNGIAIISTGNADSSCICACGSRE